MAIGRPIDLCQQGLGLGLQLRILLFLARLGPVVLFDLVDDKLVHAAEEAVQPEEVEGLQRGQQRKGDDVGDPALVLLRLPVELVGPDSAELGEDGVEDAQVDVVAEVDPDKDVCDVDGDDERAVNVVERLGELLDQTSVSEEHRRDQVKTYGQKDVADIVGYVHGNAHVRKVEAVTQPNQRQRHNMMRHQLLEILARLLKAQQHHHALLRPVRRLEQVVELEDGLVRAVRKRLVHAGRVKVPHGATAHDVDACRPHAAEVERRVHLLGEALLLAAALDAVDAAQRDEHLLHHQLARKRQHDGVKGHKGHIPEALAVVHGQRSVEVGVGVGLLVREEDEAAHGIRGRGVDGVGGGKQNQQDQGKDPGVLEGEAGEAAEQRTGFSSLLLVGREA